MFAEWEHINTVSRPKICVPSAVCQSGGSIHQLTSQTDLDEKRGAASFNTTAYPCPSQSAGRHSEYWWCLWHLGTCDRAVQWTSVAVFSPPSVCWDKHFFRGGKNWLSKLLLFLFICIRALDNFKYCFCFFRPKPEAAMSFIYSKLRQS